MTDAELKEFMESPHYAFDGKQESHYAKTRMDSYEFIIYYENEPIFRSELKKPFFSSPNLYRAGPDSNANALYIMFLFPIDDLDRETQLELRENEKLRLFTSKSGKKYITSAPSYSIVRNVPYKKIFTRNENLSPKVSIKLYKSILEISE
jgi:hypothetical protein